MEDIIDLLRERNEEVPAPLELPDDDDLVTVQEQILIHLPDDYRIFLKEVSDVICGSLAEGYYCIEQDGTILFWSHDDELTDDEWPTIWHWARDVWLES